MAEPFLWIHKDKDSEAFSQSSRCEERKIRRHVQVQRASCRQPLVNAKSPGRTDFLGRLVQTDRRKRSKPKISHVVELGKRVDSTLRSSGEVERPFSLKSILGLSSTEYRNFQFFELRTSRQWSGWQDLEFWNATVLQLAHTSKAVAHGLICLSILHQRLEPTCDRAQSTELRFMSISQANKAVSAATTGMLSYLEALTSCIILFCIYSLQKGRYAHCFLQLGARLLAECDENASRSAESSIIEHIIRPLFARLYSAPCRMSDPKAAFQLSLRRSEAIQIPRPTASWSPIVSHDFDNLAEARISLQAILGWGRASIPHSDESEMCLQEFHGQLRLFLAAWEASLTQVVSHTQNDELGDLVNAGKLLKAAARFGRIIIETAHTVTEMVYDAYFAEFSEIVQLVEDVLSKSPSGCRASFGIDNGLSDILAFTGSKCRDPYVRRQVMYLLLCSGRREGGRLAYMPGIIMKALIGLEERGLDVSSQEDVPESNRRVLIRGHQNLSKKHVRLFYAASVPESPGEEEIVDECYVPLLGLPDDSQATHDAEIPDAIFGSGQAAFLEDAKSKKYFRLEPETFYFPIPRT